MKDFPKYQKLISEIKNEVSKSRNTGSGHVIYLMISGSHLYGFNSPDSDIDYRGAYVAETNHLLGLNTPTDVWRRIDENGNDIELFEVKKLLGQVLKMNCNVMEHLLGKGTIIMSSSTFLNIQRIASEMLSKEGLYQSYRGMATFNYKKFILRDDGKVGTKPTVKKYLYVLRGLLAGTYAMRYQAIEPNLSKLNKQLLEDKLLDKLIADKQEGGEKMEANYNNETITKLDELINKQYDELDLAYQTSPMKDKPDEDDKDKVDKFLKKLRREMLQV